MERRTVQLRLGGQTYRVVTSASDEELRSLSAAVSEKLASVTPKGRAPTPQSMLLAAMALAHEAEEERARRRALERKTRDLLRRVLVRVDSALEPLLESDSEAGS
jgi:cell division protein ZapA